jgi:hypothetical protein
MPFSEGTAFLHREGTGKESFLGGTHLVTGATLFVFLLGPSQDPPNKKKGEFLDS